jgi:membrane protease YdiL (CAAX protease family)
MSTEPERDPLNPQDSTPEGNADEPEILGAPSFPRLFAERVGDHEPEPAPLDPDQPIPAEAPLFHSWSQPEIPPPARIPNLGHLLILASLMIFGSAVSMLLTWSALHFHLFGVSTIKQAEADVHYTLGGMAILYLIPFAASLLVFPLLWHKSFFAGLQWNLASALRLRRRLFGAACACFVLAMIDGLLLPGPANAPIDKLFQTSLAAWLLFAFGVTFAPFFEEILFRGFLLPALSTAFDWTVEHFTHSHPPPLDENAHPQWSVPAMAVASILTSIPFALMHAEQTGYSLGPFLLLLCVSLVLCWVRLTTRSLAASVLVHACYNFLLFSLMLLGTNGFQHLDKM